MERQTVKTEQFNEALNEFFSRVQKSIPYSDPNRDMKMNGQYAMYIGMLEGIIKTNVPANKRKEIIASLDRITKEMFK